MSRQRSPLGTAGWVGLSLLTVAVMAGVLSIVLRDEQVATADASTPTLVLADPLQTYDPVKAGEPLPEGFRQVVRRDVIEPVYDPKFVTGDSVDWGPDTLVVGVVVEGAAKAYPVNYMNVHEMVNDRIAGLPILVSW
jgi:hypothetical protein